MSRGELQLQDSRGRAAQGGQVPRARGQGGVDRGLGRVQPRGVHRGLREGGRVGRPGDRGRGVWAQVEHPRWQCEQCAVDKMGAFIPVILCVGLQQKF